MRKIIIDEEFKGLLPALDKETFALLEENILQNGCRDSLVLWNGILIDGHNRYEICTKHKISFNTIDKQFDSREDALIWIVSTQISRRNLKPLQLSHYRGIHYRADKQIRGGNDRVTDQNRKCHSDTYEKSTARRLAEQYKVSLRTITRDAKVAEAIDAIGEVSPEAKRKILSGEAPIDKKVLQGLSAKPTEEITELAKKIDAGSYERPKPNTTKPEGGEDSGSGSAAAPQLTEAIANLSVGFHAGFRKHMGSGDIKAAKTAMRSYIKQLQSFYRELS